MRLLLGVLIACTLVAPAAAQNLLRAEQGREIAARWCAECHAIGAGDGQARALTGAPSFPDIGARGAASPEALRRALLGDHPVMPQFPVSDEEIRALSDYINSIDGASPATPPEAEDRAEAVGAGKEIVSANCAPCHDATGPGPSPVSHAPVLATLSERYPIEYLAEALAEGLAVGHPTVSMPEFVFEPDEINAILAYLDSIQVN